VGPLPAERTESPVKVVGGFHGRMSIRLRNRRAAGSLTRMRQLFARIGMSAAFVSVACVSVSAQERWIEYTDARGTRVEYPRDLFSVRKQPEGGGEVLSTRDGRARLHMFSMANPRALAPSAFIRSHFPAPRSTLKYDRVARNFFALSTRRQGMIVYLRCNFSSARGGTLHCVDIRYPASEKRAWDGIVTRISRSIRPLPSQ
jgi:hypothetical protein